MVAAALALGLLLSSAGPARADDAQDANQLVEKAKLTVEEFQKEPNMDSFRALAKKAHGMLILPQMLRGAFIIGASGGQRRARRARGAGRAMEGPGILHARRGELRLPGGRGRGRGDHPGDDRARSDEAPQPAGEARRRHQRRGRAGRGGAAAATAGLSADLVSYSMSKGLYGGFSVDGSVAGVRSSLNKAYYGKETTPTDILIKGDAKNPQAASLLEAVTTLGK